MIVKCRALCDNCAFVLDTAATSASRCRSEHESRHTIMSNTPPVERVGNDQPELPLLLDSPLRGQVRGDWHVVTFSLFPIDDRLITEPITLSGRYNGLRYSIEITPKKGHAIATMADKELLIYLMSLIAQKMDEGEDPSPTLRIAAIDFFKVAGIQPNGKAYKRLVLAIERLTHTSITMEVEGIGEEGNNRIRFSHWLSDGSVEFSTIRGRGTRKVRTIEVTLGMWLFEKLKNDRSLVSYTKRYFELTPFERRLYEVVRAHCGVDPGDIALEDLHTLVDPRNDLRRFAYKLRKTLTERDGIIPGYRLEIVDAETGEPYVPRRGVRREQSPLVTIKPIIDNRLGHKDHEDLYKAKPLIMPPVQTKEGSMV